MSSVGNKRKSGADEKGKKKARKSKKGEESDGSDFEEKSEGSPAQQAAAELKDDEFLEVSDLTLPGPPHLGTLLLCGSTNWDTVGRKVPPKGKNIGRTLFVPHRFSPLDGIKVKLAISGCNAAHNVVITEEGKVLAWGRNEKGQLGTKDCNRRDVPTPMEGVQNFNFIGAAVGRHHTLILTDHGAVYACGDNKMGQCGINSTAPVITLPTRVRHIGPPIVKVGCGADFSMILDCKGVLYSFGSPEYGQLGHGTTGEFIAQSNKVSYNIEKVPKKITTFIEKGRDNRVTSIEIPEIIDFSNGTNHTVALDSRKRVYSWGWGGYGRLGHADTKDEMVPRLMQFFTTTGRGIKSVHCGSSYSLAVNEHGMAFMFGVTKKSGEANMYPKPVRDLQGWKVRSIGCSNTSIVIAADESVVAYGPSPTYGELGLGEMRRSSSQPMEVKKLEGIYVQHVSCGVGHTLMIARNETDEDKKKLDALPGYSPTS